MDVIGEAIANAFHLCNHVHKSHRRGKRKKCTLKRIARVTLVTSIIAALTAYIIDVSLKCADSYKHPVYDGNVESRDEMLLPIVYICTVEGRSMLNFHKCYVDSDFAFDSKTLTPGPNATECSIKQTEIPADTISMGNHLKNWTCVVFNELGSLNASQSTNGMESIHIAFQGGYTKPLVAVLADKEAPHLHRNSEPNWIFSMGTNVFALIGKSMYTDLDNDVARVTFTSTVSSSVRSVSGSLLQYCYLSVSYSSYEITHYEQIVKFDWSAALGSIGGATCLVRLFLFCLIPNENQGQLNDDDNEKNFGGDNDDQEEIIILGGSSSSSRTLSLPLMPRMSLSE